MADGEYKRLSCRDCNTAFTKIAQQGRPPVRCEPCRAEKRGPSVPRLSTCAHCGGEKPPGNAMMYCSKRCTWNAQGAKKAARKRAAKALAPKPVRHCLCCGAEITRANPLATYCSVYCKRKHWAQRYPEKVAIYERTAREILPYSRVAFNTCRVCGKKWTGQTRQRFCSDACRKRQACIEGLAREEAEHRAAGRVLTCRRCGCQYCPLYGCKPGPTPLCQPCAVSKKRDAKRARGGQGHESRARHFGVERKSFNVLRILERDKWRCQLCGVSTPKRLRGTTDPRAPELDHIIPLSAGGPHLPHNVQCACRQCNSDKGARPLGQLGLIGFAT